MGHFFSQNKYFVKVAVPIFGHQVTKIRPKKMTRYLAILTPIITIFQKRWDFQKTKFKEKNL
jgi:hypothetical protein